MTNVVRLGLLGGTLDPVHLGHVDAAIAARDALALDRVLMIPSRTPPHRPLRPTASPWHRFAMAALAVDGLDAIEVSDVELDGSGPSYTAGTLDRIKAEGFDASQLFFITGADAFAEIATWHRYPEVLDLANFVVVSRPGHDLDRSIVRVPGISSRLADLDAAATPASRTRIFRVPAHTRDVSSTEIRRRLRAGESLHGLVPDAVERHIHRHRLYSEAGAPAVLRTSADHLHGQD